MNMIRKVQQRFMMIPTLISAAMLLVIFGMIYFISFSSADRLARAHIALDLGNYRSENFLDAPTDRLGLCMEFTVRDGHIEHVRLDMVEEDERAQLLQAVLSANGHKIAVEGKTYYIGSQTVATPAGLENKYAIYDFTASQTHLTMLGISLACIYLVTIAAVALISHMLSKSAVAPLQQAFDKQKELVANASHELKTPLTIVSTNLDLIRSMPDQTVADQSKWLDSAAYQLSRMNHLIRQMLELTAMDQYRDRPIEQVDVNKLCKGMLLSFEAACYERNIDLQTSLAEGVYLRCNRDELEKLVTILVDNAKKYCEEGGRIRFELTRVSRNVCIRVSNTGGIPQDKIDKVFERFYKADPAHAENGNSFGLGLSIARSIAEWMGGEISCRNERDCAVFEVVLPLNHKYA